MKKIKISETLSLPVEVVTQNLGFMARRGAGKTYTAGILVEGLHKAGAQVVVLDPVGNWWGLRLAADGKTSGLDIPVIGGDHGDLPIDPSSGKILAELIVEQRISAVLDVSEFSKTKFKQFVYEFATRLFQLKKKHRSPLHIVFEEAQLVAPQRIDRDEGKMMGAIESLVRLGRNYGIGSSLISQRPQSVHKDVLNQVECLFVGQINGAHERKAIQEWIVEKGIDIKEMVKQLSSLPIGTAFIWSPQWLKIFRKVKIGKKKTYDASSTPTFSTKKTEPMELKPVNMDAIREAMSQISEKARKENPHFLKAEVQRVTTENARLKRDLEKSKKTVIEKTATQVTVCGVDPKKKEIIIRAMESMFKAVVKHLDAGGMISSKPASKIITEATALKIQATSISQDNGNLKGGAARMAQVLAQSWPRVLTKTQLGTMAGLRHTSGTFGTYLSMLRNEGIFNDTGSGYQATEYCRNLYGGLEPIPIDPEQLLEFWKGKFNGGAVRMLEAIASRNGEPISREEIGIEAEISSGSGTFGTYLSGLTSNGIVERLGNGQFRICSDLINKKT